MKNSIFFTLLFLIFFTSQKFQAQSQDNGEIHKATVKQVLQTTNYTYLFVHEVSGDNWLALPKMEAKPGETYYYKSGFKMTNFESKELGKKFETIYFLESVSSTPGPEGAISKNNPHGNVKMSADSPGQLEYTAKVEVKKESVSVQPAEQGVTIANLFSNKDKYNGKTVRVKGKVTKFNKKIMKKNWIHIQDGTEFNGKFDLTATTGIEVEVGQTLTLEGKVVLNKDFGYGYNYEVLLEDAVIAGK